MEQSRKVQLMESGIDIDKALIRFLYNEEMYGKFLVKFLEDKNFEILRESIFKNDLESAFIAAHTLKGVAANLEFTGILEYLTPMVEILRKNKMDGTKELMEQMEKNYDKVYAAISNVSGR